MTAMPSEPRTSRRRRAHRSPAAPTPRPRASPTCTPFSTRGCRRVRAGAGEVASWQRSCSRGLPPYRSFPPPFRHAAAAHRHRRVPARRGRPRPERLPRPRCSRAASRTPSRPHLPAGHASPRWRWRCAGRARTSVPVTVRGAASYGARRRRALRRRPDARPGAPRPHRRRRRAPTSAWSAPGRACASIHALLAARDRALPVYSSNLGRHVRRLARQRRRGPQRLRAAARRSTSCAPPTSCCPSASSCACTPTGASTCPASAPRQGHREVAADQAEAWFRASGLEPFGLADLPAARACSASSCRSCSVSASGPTIGAFLLEFATRDDACERPPSASAEAGRTLPRRPTSSSSGRLSWTSARDLGARRTRALAAPAVGAVRRRQGHAVGRYRRAARAGRRRGLGASLADAAAADSASAQRRLPLRRLPGIRGGAALRDAPGRPAGAAAGARRRERALRRRALPPAAEQAARPRPAGRRDRRCRPTRWPPSLRRRRPASRAVPASSSTPRSTTSRPTRLWSSPAISPTTAGRVLRRPRAGAGAARPGRAAASAAGPTCSGAGRRRSRADRFGAAGLERLRALKAGLDPQDLV